MNTPESGKKVRLITRLLIISAVMVAGMTGYEYAKQLLFPNIAIWESHIVTIIFSTLVAAGAAYFILQHGDKLLHQAQNELTRREAVEKQLKELVLKDELTGLYNRRGFMTIAEQQIKLAYRLGQRLVLLYIDVNNLKQINDTLGHAQGDQALVGLSVIFQDIFRESDLLGRVGGDEFVVLTLDKDGGAGQPAQRLQQAVSAYNKNNRHPFKLSVSIGLSYCEPDRQECAVEELLAEADKKMYAYKTQAKKVGESGDAIINYQNH